MHQMASENISPPSDFEVCSISNDVYLLNFSNF